MNKVPYNQRDHQHCWSGEGEPPCGIKGKHRCCLCGLAPQDRLCKICNKVHTVEVLAEAFSDEPVHDEDIAEKVLKEHTPQDNKGEWLGKGSEELREEGQAFVDKHTDIDEIVKKLREPSNWLKQPRGEHWKDVVNKYDRTPFEASDLLEKLQQAIEKVRAEAFDASDDYWKTHLREVRLRGIEKGRAERDKEIVEKLVQFRDDIPEAYGLGKKDDEADRGYRICSKNVKAEMTRLITHLNNKDI